MKTVLYVTACLLISGSVFSQNVGIDIANPVYKLDVRNGSINTDSVYRIGSMIALSVQGPGNLFVGTKAGPINTGTNNTFSGDSSGFFNTIGYKNSFFGESSGFRNSFGIRNTFVGQEAGYANTEGSANCFYGQEAGLNNTLAHFNSFFGSESGRYNTIGIRNSFFGMASGLNNNSGSRNSFFGQDAGLYNSSGSSNSFMGHEAGYINSTGFNNSFFGQTAGYSNNTGSNNTAVGDSANVVSGALNNATAIGAKARVDCDNCLVLGSVSGINGSSSNVKVGIGTTSPLFKLDVKNGSINTDSLYRIGAVTVLAVKGSNNLFIGKDAGRINTGMNNTFSGYHAGYANIAGNHNSFFGEQSGVSNISGSDNAFFGKFAGASNTGGYSNSYFGNVAGYVNSTGHHNSSFGLGAGFNNAGSNNSFFGAGAGSTNTSGFSNSFFGTSAGQNNTTGYNNTALGDSANVGTGALTNATAVGANARADCTNCLVLGSVNGVNGAISNVNVGIGTNSPNSPLAFGPVNGKKISLFAGGIGDLGFSVQPFQLRIHGDPGTSISMGIDSASNFRVNLDIYANGNAWMRGTLFQASDARLKKDIMPLQNSLEKITQLTGYNYYWKSGNAEQGIQSGVLAQEVQKLFPDLVQESKEGILSVNYSGLIPVLIESIKEQQKQNDQHQQQINQQQQQIDELKKFITREQ